MNMDEKNKAKVSVGAMLSVMELVIAIGVFAVISTFLLRFFTVANRLSDEAKEVSKAGITAEAILEYAKGAGYEATLKEFGLTEDGGVAKADYDEKFYVVKDGSTRPVYSIEVTRTKDGLETGELSQYNIKIKKLKNDKLLFDFTGKSYEKVVGDEQK